MARSYLKMKAVPSSKYHPYFRTPMGSFFFGILIAAFSHPSLGFPRTPPLLAPLTSSAAVPSKTQSLKKVTFASLNDFHGRLDTYTNEYGNLKVPVGGAATIAAYFDILQAQNPDGFGVFTVGDDFAGSLVSVASQGEPVARFFNWIPVIASAVGNHEYDFGKEAFARYTGWSNRPYITTNTSGALKGTVPYHLKRMANGVTVGIMGLTTLETREHASQNIAGLRFDKWADVAVNTALKLRKLGANAVVALAHGGGRCDMTQPAEKGNEACDLNNETGELLEHLGKLPEPLIDVVFTAHVHAPQAHFVNRMAVVQTTAYGQSFGRVDLWVDTKAPVRFDATNPTSRNTAVKEVKVHAPTFFCTHHFHNAPTCVVDDTNPHLTPALVAKGPLVPATYEGSPITPRADVDGFLRPYREKAEAIGREPLVAAGVDSLEGDRRFESKMGQCVVDTLFQYTKQGQFRPVDGLILNSAVLRGRFPGPGRMTMSHAFDMIPFPNTLVLVDLTLDEIELFVAELAGRSEETALIAAPWKAAVRGSQGHSKATVFMPPPTHRKKVFTVATSSYLLAAYDNLKPFAKGHRFLDSEVLLRDALALQLKNFDGSPGKVAPSSCSTLHAFRPRIDLMQITQNSL